MHNALLYSLHEESISFCRWACSRGARSAAACTRYQQGSTGLSGPQGAAAAAPGPPPASACAGNNPCCCACCTWADGGGISPCRSCRAIAHRFAKSADSCLTCGERLFAAAVLPLTSACVPGLVCRDCHAALSTADPAASAVKCQAKRLRQIATWPVTLTSRPALLPLLTLPGSPSDGRLLQGQWRVHSCYRPEQSWRKE